MEGSEGYRVLSHTILVFVPACPVGFPTHSLPVLYTLSIPRYERGRGARDMRPSLYKVLGGLIVVLVLSTIALVPVESLIASAEQTTTNPGTSASNTTNTTIAGVRERVAERIISNVENKIEKILSLADEYNISIPENLTVLVDEARKLLDNATSLVEENPCEAIKLALRAAKTFRPVAVYVLSSLPENVREELLASSLERLVEERLNAIDRFEEKLAYLEEYNVTIPEIVYEKISQAREILEQAKEELDSGLYNVSDIMAKIRQADRLLAEATVILYRYFGRIWHTLSLIDAAYHKLIMGTIAVARAINYTVRLVEENNTTVAVNITSRLIKVVDNIIDYLNRTLVILEEHNRSGNATLLVETLYNTLVEVRSHLDKALSSLEANDTITALDELKQALDKLVATLEENQQLIRGIHHNIDKLKHASKAISESLEKALKKIALRKTAELIVFLARLKARLYWLEKLYENGNITSEEYASALNHAKTILENILDYLEKAPTKPEKIINAIEELIDWINEQLASIQG